MTNRQGYAEAYRDVIHEDALIVEKSARAPERRITIEVNSTFFARLVSRRTLVLPNGSS
jgi:hypothetical protein